VSGPNLQADSTAVVWSVTDDERVPLVSGTAIDENTGVLSVAENETAAGLVVTAAARYADGTDSGVSGAATVTLGNVPVRFIGVSAYNSFDPATKLTFYFSRNIEGLSASHITLTDSGGTGIQAGTLSPVDGTEGVYELAVSRVARPGTIRVAVAANPVPGYAVSGGPMTVTISYHAGIKSKLGITTNGVQGVSDTFNALHGFILSNGLTDSPGLIRLGDYIDLEGGLSVDPYGNEQVGGFQHPVNTPIAVSVTNAYNPGFTGALLRLIVVGINSFHSNRGAGNQYNVILNDDTPHVVFQFQNLPVSLAMNDSLTYAGSYKASRMRKYLVGENGTSGNFLTGLINAGVPANVLWGPVRYISTASGDSLDTITDTVWLPTEREQFGFGIGNTNNGVAFTSETIENQTWLEYYVNDILRTKYSPERDGYPDNINTYNGNAYALASPHRSSANNFCRVNTTGGTGKISADGSIYIAPAFCVK
jgi:hypothetical protein